MDLGKHKWFEIWYEEGEDLLPSWLLLVAPDLADPKLIRVYDPFEGFKIAYESRNYDEVVNFLREDEFYLATGRMFIDDTFPLETKPSSSSGT